MIKKVKMYSVVCDRCGKQFLDEFNGIVAWLYEGTAKEQAMEERNGRLSMISFLGLKVSLSILDVLASGMVVEDT